MIRRIVILIIAATLTADSFAGSAAADPADSLVTTPRKSPAGAIITVSLIAAVGLGAGGFILIRKRMRERQHADSVIAAVERTWDSASAAYAHEQYREAVRQLQSISARWYEYEQYSTRYKKDRHVNPDSIRAVIASCDFLEQMITPVKALSEFAEELPADEFELSKISRRDLTTARQYLRHSMDSIMTVHVNHRTALRYSFRHIEKRLQSLDSLTNATYAQQKAAFSSKTKFYYNRAAEKNDTAALRDFADDCDYYQIDKEWCQRARLVLEEKGSAAPAMPQTKGKLTVKDSMQLAFSEAVQSNRIEVLESYLKKYSARRYRSYLKAARLDSARIVLKSLRAVIDGQVSFNRAYPRFGNADPEIPVVAKGLSSAAENAFSGVWHALKPELGKLPAIRLPARLTIDYTNKPPILLLDAIFTPASDVEKNSINSRSSYRITCLVPAMKLLQRLKKLTIVKLQETAATGSRNADIVDYDTKKIDAATFAVRLVKPGSNNAILFYAHDRSGVTRDTSATIQFYDFYDIAITGSESKRLPVYSSSLPDIIPSIAPDSLEQVMGEKFFGE